MHLSQVHSNGISAESVQAELDATARSYAAMHQGREKMESEFTTTINGFQVSVDKDGGGTLGCAYNGSWTVTVKNGPVFIFDQEWLSTGTAKTHRQVARLAYEYAQEEI